MRNLIFIALLFSSCLTAQQSSVFVKYNLSVLAQDSFYLVETTVSNTTGRRDTLVDNILFKDSISFATYVNENSREVSVYGDRVAFLKMEYDSLRSRANVLENLLSNYSTLVGSSNRFAPPPGEIDLAPPPANNQPTIPDKKKAKKKKKQ